MADSFLLGWTRSPSLTRGDGECISVALFYEGYIMSIGLVYIFYNFGLRRGKR